MKRETAMESPEQLGAPTERIQPQAIFTLFLCGDCMTGRGIDQILPHPVPPHLFEPYVRDARRYVELAERHNGPIPRNAPFGYVWGDALVELRLRAPDVRIVNLETAVTTSEEHWPGKGIHYRMHPANAPVLTAAALDVCALANNHVLDWGYPGLAETVETLRHAGVRWAGAGRDLAAAEAPAFVELPGRGRVLVFSFGTESSGIPDEWTAAPGRAGVNLLQDLSGRAVTRIGRMVRTVKRQGDIVVASIHWGGNWGYSVPDAHREFARRLIDEAGVDLIHGHSSHHVMGIEVYREKLVLYGCGDFITDYEGIEGYEEFRGELRLMYFPRVDALTGRLAGVEMVPMEMRNFRVNRAAPRDALWLRDLLNREGKRFGTGAELSGDSTLVLRWGKQAGNGR
nr:CapA family protein [Geobacter sp.]